VAIYLDYAATSPMPEAVLAAYTDALRLVGNPASVHSAGQNAKRLLEESRERVAATLGAEPVNVIFTSGGTESVNLAIKGLYWARNASARRPRVLTPGSEHHAAVDAAEWLARTQDGAVEWIPVDAEGIVTPAVLEALLDGRPDDAALVNVMLANNETGAIAPLVELVEVAHRFGVPVHSDAVSAYGYVPIDFHGLGVDALSVSGHKIGAPVGIGALLISRTASLEPLAHGGNQQRIRSGTQDAAGAVAFAVAAELAVAGIEAEAVRLSALRDRLIEGVHRVVPEAILRGPAPGPQRLPGNAHFTFPGCEGDSLLFLLDAGGFSVSTGSACQAGVPEASHVLTAMGISPDDARGALRMSIGHDTTRDDVDAFLVALPDAFTRATRAGLANA